jgi:hypothetical protein
MGCNACMNLIYDILISPLPLDHELYDHIHFKSLERCAVEVAYCFYRAVRDFPIYPEFFRNEIQPPVLAVSLRIRIPDQSLNKYEYEEIIWNRFHEECPVWAYELQHAIDICIDYSIGRLCIDKNMLVKHFLMGILHKILLHVPTLHKEHSTKAKPIEYKSLGAVDIWKIIEVRQKAFLPIEKYLKSSVFS